jgi:pilus assembly protein CpaF
VFAIIISEKGGAERRETFDKNEINVGRVQGNDLMLPKGNVSKHHARLLFRDGRFIVTDLKSTNGTYVNGRKIAQATIVREGDKIYIGDFVLRLETNGAAAAPEPTTGSEEESIRTLARDGQRPPAPLPNPPAVTLKAPTHPPGAPLPRPQVSNVSNAPPIGAPPAPVIGVRGTDASGPPQGYGLEHDPDDSAPLQKPRTASGQSAAAVAPPMNAAMPRPMTMPLNQMSPPVIGQRVPSGTSMPAVAPPAAPAAAPRPPEPPLPPPVAVQPPPQVQAPPPPAPAQPSPAAPAPSAPPPRHSAPPRAVLKETPAQAGRRLAMTMLMGRIADAVDLSTLRQTPHVPDALAQQIERAAREQAQAMREEGEAPPDVDLDAVVRDAHRELVGIGAFGPLLEDEDVSEIHCLRFDQLFTIRNGVVTNEGAGFSSEEALHRVVARLAHQSGEPMKPGEVVVERRLPRASFVAIAPPVAAGHVVSIRKRRRVEATLDEMTRTGGLSRPMAQFLEACIASRANVLVAGPAPIAALAALASSGAAGERVCVVHDVDEIAVGNAHAVTLSLSDTRTVGEECVRAAAKLRPDRLVVTQLVGGVAAATVDAMAEGADGVLAAIAAPTLRQALSRLVAQLVLHRPGLGLDAMREVIGEAFDIAVEVTAQADGRPRIVRIAELGGSDAKGIVARDVFVWSADPASGDGSFGATGVVPRIANDLAARGMKLEPSIFKRSGR